MAGFEATDNSQTQRFLQKMIAFTLAFYKSQTILFYRFGKSKSTKRQKTLESRISEESASIRIPQWLERNELHHQQQLQPFDDRKHSVDTEYIEVEEDEDEPENDDDDYYLEEGLFLKTAVNKRPTRL